MAASASGSVYRHPSYFLCVIIVLKLLIVLPTVILAANIECPVACQCLGVTVDCEKRELTSVPRDLQPWTKVLLLGSNKISSLPDDVFATLVNLEEIKLCENQLTFLNGSVFANLPKLKKIIVRYNQLESFPHFPVTLPVVEELVLSHNSIESLPPRALDNLPNLRQLNVNYNRIQGLRNDSFSLHPHLHQLYLNNNRISVVAPNVFANLSNLQWLKLTKNKIQELPKNSFSKLKELKVLELSKNELRSIEGLMFKGLDQLKTLSLKRNHISSLMDGAFYGLDRITELYLDHNNISAVMKGWMYGLKSLQQLSLSQNSVEHIEEEAWDDCSHLTELDLSYNKLRSVSESTFLGLSSLKTLSLDFNHIASIADEAFIQLHSLDRLYLSHNELSSALEEATGAFSGLSALTRLGLAHNHVRSLAGRAFASLTSLRQLHLEDNPLTAIHADAFPSSLQTLRLNSSAFLCDCQLGWLGEWLRRKGFGEMGAEDVSVSARCAHPQHLSGQNVIDVPADSFQCVNMPKPVLVRQPEKQIALKGSNLTLVCEAASSQAAMVPMWKRDNQELSGSGPDGTVTNLESASGAPKPPTDEISVTGNPEVTPSGDTAEEQIPAAAAVDDGTTGTVTLVSTLYIPNVTDRHRGTYQCIVSNSLGTTYSDKADISVNVFPTFMRRPSDVTVRAGSQAKLACAAVGEPKPEIVWQKVGGDDFPAARERRMGVSPPDMYFIENVKSQDQGVYSCMATNDAGTIVANATLQVLEVPHFIDVVGMQDVEVRLGHTAVVKCQVAGNPLPRISWYKDGNPLSTSVRHYLTGDDQLLVVVETERDDAGEYECLATNTLGETRGVSYLVVRGGKGQPGVSTGGLDKSTMTGIIIIAVVCCVVGTSLVWVIIIYHTRKKRADDAADKDGASPGGMMNPGPYHQSYSEVVPVVGGFAGLYGGESQTVPLTGDDDDSRLHNGWPTHRHPSLRRHSDSASSHSTQSTRSTGLLSTFHPGTLGMPHHSTLLLTYDTAASPGQYMAGGSEGEYPEQRGEGAYMEQPSHHQEGAYLEHPHHQQDLQQQRQSYTSYPHIRYSEHPHNDNTHCIENEHLLNHPQNNEQLQQQHIASRPHSQSRNSHGLEGEVSQPLMAGDSAGGTVAPPSIAVVHALQHPHPPPREKQEDESEVQTFPPAHSPPHQQTCSHTESSSSTSSPPSSSQQLPSSQHPLSSTMDATCQGSAGVPTQVHCDTINSTDSNSNHGNSNHGDSAPTSIIICDSKQSNSTKTATSKNQQTANCNGSIPNGSIPNGKIPNGKIPNGVIPNGLMNGLHEPLSGKMSAVVS